MHTYTHTHMYVYMYVYVKTADPYSLVLSLAHSSKNHLLRSCQWCCVWNEDN